MATGQPSEASQDKKPRYDHLLKWILTQAHDDLLRLIAPGTTWQGERSPEVPAIARLADLVWEVRRPQDRRGLLHIELQTEVEDDLGERLAEYAIRLWRRDHLDVRSVVILLRRTAKAPASPFVIPWDENDSLRYTFQVIRLWEIPYDQALHATTYAFWPLAGLMAGATVETTVEIAERLSQAPLPRQEQSDLVGLLAGLSGLTLPREAVVTALRRVPVIDDLLRESGVIELFREEAMREGLAEGRAKGLAEGRAKGLAEGRAEEARRIVTLMLESRFGALSDDVRTAINQADEATLEDIVIHSADSLEQARARLGLN